MRIQVQRNQKRSLCEGKALSSIVWPIPLLTNHPAFEPLSFRGTVLRRTNIRDEWPSSGRDTSHHRSLFHVRLPIFRVPNADCTSIENKFSCARLDMLIQAQLCSFEKHLRDLPNSSALTRPKNSRLFPAESCVNKLRFFHLWQRPFRSIEFRKRALSLQHSPGLLLGQKNYIERQSEGR
jgi:hypothetical protein